MIAATQEVLEPFTHSVSAQAWYKALGDVGYKFGYHFQKQTEIESVAGRRCCRVRLSLADPPSAYVQSKYQMHPVCIDGCLQSAVPSLWGGHRSSVDTALVPAIIDDLVICSCEKQPETGIAVTTSEYVGIGRLSEAKNYKSHISVYDTRSGYSIFELKGLHYNELDTHTDRHLSHSFTRLCWKPDLSFLTEKQLCSLLAVEQPYVSTNSDNSLSIRLSHVLDMVAHKKPNATVMEVDATSSSQSIWLEPSDGCGACRAACPRYLFTTNSLPGLEEGQKEYQNFTVAEFAFCDILTPCHEFVANADFDLVILKLVSLSYDSS